MPSTIATRVLMVRPASFRCNEETAATNAFQAPLKQKHTDASRLARDEFEALRKTLTSHGIEVAVQDEPPSANTPDALFPNNWFAFLPDGPTFLFPMQAPNRQREVHPEWLSPFSAARPVVDLRDHIKNHEFLEGTGSLILDHRLKQGYACLSPRTNPRVIADFAAKSGYQVTTFTASDKNGTPFYHTNVMMALGVDTVIVCSESIMDANERHQVLQRLERSGRRIVHISFDQVANFCGNMLQLASQVGQRYWVCSDRALNALTPQQKTILETDAEFIHAPLPTIETLGGGSARCMIGEIF